MKQLRFNLRGLLIFIAVISVVLTLIVLIYPTRQKAVAKIFGGRAGIRTVAKPDRVFAFRVELPKEIFYEDAVASDYRITSDPVALSTANIKKVSAVLLSPDTYGWEDAFSCGFSPDRKLTFIRDSEQVDVVFHADCPILYIYLNNDFVGGEDFINAQRVFESVFSESFAE